MSILFRFGAARNTRNKAAEHNFSHRIAKLGFSLLLACTSLNASAIASEDRTKITDLLTANSASAPNEILTLSNVDGDFDIYLVDVTTGESRNLTQNDHDDVHAVWSPDGKRIAYVNNASGRGDIYVMDLSTEQVKRLTDESSSDIVPKWSPDGQYLTFASMDLKGASSIKLYSFADKKLRQLYQSNAELLSPEWSSDSQKIVFLKTGEGRGPSIHTISIDGSNMQTVVSETKSDKQSPRWSPDNQKILYVAKRSRVVGLYAVDIESGEEIQVDPSTAIDAEGEFHASGALAFLSARGNGVRRQVYLSQHLDAPAIRLTIGDMEESDLNWLDDGSGLLFTRYVDGRFQTMHLDLATKVAKVAAPNLGGVHYAPKARPRQTSP